MFHKALGLRMLNWNQRKEEAPERMEMTRRKRLDGEDRQRLQEATERPGESICHNILRKRLLVNSEMKDNCCFCQPD